MKIDFISVSFRNFLSYGNKTQFIEFKPGINIVTGVDTTTGRSNGAGKCIAGNTQIDIEIDNIEIYEKFQSIC